VNARRRSARLFRTYVVITLIKKGDLRTAQSESTVVRSSRGLVPESLDCAGAHTPSMISSLIKWTILFCLLVQYSGAIDLLMPEMRAHVSELFKDKESKYVAKDGASNSAVRQPYHLAFDRDGTLLVTSFHWNHIVSLRFTSRNKARYRIFSKDPRLDGPVGLAFDPTYRHVYVSSFSTDKIIRLDASNGKFLGMFGNEDQIDCPQGIAFGPDGRLYVVSFLKRHLTLRLTIRRPKRLDL